MKSHAAPMLRSLLAHNWVVSRALSPRGGSVGCCWVGRPFALPYVLWMARAKRSRWLYTLHQACRRYGKPVCCALSARWVARGLSLVGRREGYRSVGGEGVIAWLLRCFAHNWVAFARSPRLIAWVAAASVRYAVRFWNGLSTTNPPVLYPLLSISPIGEIRLTRASRSMGDEGKFVRLLCRSVHFSRKVIF